MSIYITCKSYLPVIALSAGWLLAGLAGCGGGSDAPQRYPILGRVTLDGNPLENGEVLILPADGKGRPDAGAIKNGEFAFDCTQGSKRVEITSTKEIPPASPGGVPDYVALIPKKYNSASTLTAEVKPSRNVSDNTFEFALKTK